MKNLWIYGTLSVAFFLSACTDDELIKDNVDLLGKNTYVITADKSSTDTRFTYEPSQTTSGIGVTWASTDHLSIFPNSNSTSVADFTAFNPEDALNLLKSKGTLTDEEQTLYDKYSELLSRGYAPGNKKCTFAYTGDLSLIDGDYVYAFYNTSNTTKIPVTDASGKVITENSSGKIVEKTIDAQNCPENVYCNFRNQVQYENNKPIFEKTDGSSVDFRTGKNKYNSSLNNDLPGIALNSLSSFLKIKFKLRNNQNKAAGVNWKPCKLTLMTEKCTFDTLVVTHLDNSSNFVPFATVYNDIYNTSKSDLDGKQTSFMSVNLWNKDDDGNITKYWNDAVLTQDNIDDVYTVYMAVPPTTLKSGQYIQLSILMTYVGGTSSGVPKSFVYPIKLKNDYALNAGECRCIDFSSVTESKDYLLNGTFYINPVLIETGNNKGKYSYWGQGDLICPYITDFGGMNANIEDVKKETSSLFYDGNKNNVAIYDCSFDGMEISTAAEEINNPSTGELTKTGKILGKITRYSRYPIFSFKYENGECYPFISNVTANSTWFNNDTHSASWVDENTNKTYTWPRDDWENSWKRWYSKNLFNGGKSVGGTCDEVRLPSIKNNEAYFIDCPFLPYGLSGLTYGCTYAVDSFWSSYANVDAINDTENLNYAQKNVDLGGDYLTVSNNERFAVWYKMYLEKNAATTSNYYVNTGTFEIEYGDNLYYTASGKWPSDDTLFDNGKWTYTGGVSFPLAFWLHNVSYNVPANISSYGITILDGEEFRLTAPISTTADKVTNIYSRVNIWCFKRK